jgi:hypothetical protein
MQRFHQALPLWVRLPALAAELADLRVGVILASGGPTSAVAAISGET